MGTVADGANLIAFLVIGCIMRPPPSRLLGAAAAFAGGWEPWGSLRPLVSWHSPGEGSAV